MIAQSIFGAIDNAQQDRVYNKWFEDLERESKEWEAAWDKWMWSGGTLPEPVKPRRYEQYKKIKDEQLRGRLVLPGSNFIGPGNKIVEQMEANVQATNRADAVAEEHDKIYTMAKSQEEVHQADIDARDKFFKAATTNNPTPLETLHGLAGAIGMQVKQSVEQSLGRVLYPTGLPLTVPSSQESQASSLPTPPPTPQKGQKRPAEEAPAEEQAPKEARTEETSQGTSEQTATPVQPESMSAGSTPGHAFGTAGDNAGPVLIGQGHTPGTTNIFTKKWLLETVGFAPTQFDNSSIFPNFLDTFAGANPSYLATNFVNLDPNYLQWFMSRAEYNQLPDYTWAKRCRFSVRPLGYRIPFATGQSTSQDANNSATLVQVAWARAFNHEFDGLNVQLTFPASNPTVPSSIATQTTTPESLLYLDSNACVLGNVRWWNNYYAICNDNGNALGNPYIMKNATICNIADVRGTEVASLEYEYRNAPLKYSRDLGYETNRYMGAGDNNIYASQPGIASTVTTAGPGRNNQHRVIGFEPQPMQVNGGYFNYDQRVEKSDFCTTAMSPNQSAIAPPLLHFAAMPLKSNQVGGTPSWLPVTTTWEISCEIETMTINNHMFTSFASPSNLRMQIPRNFSTDIIFNPFILSYWKGNMALAGLAENTRLVKAFEEPVRTYILATNRALLADEEEQQPMDLAHNKRTGR